MTIAHSLGFPRIGKRRELKKAVEAFWRGELTQEQLLAEGKALRQQHWQWQAEAGLDYVPVGDFAWYDQVLNVSCTLGVIPSRFLADAQQTSTTVDLDLYFKMARGYTDDQGEVAACEMTKWFDTNYHYLVPEFTENQSFKISSNQLLDEIEEASQLGLKAKPVLLGPLSYLWLGKAKGSDFDKLTLLDELVSVYGELLAKIAALGIEWVQLDEPILTLDLPNSWRQGFETAYNRLQSSSLNILLATYFGALADNLATTINLPTEGLHIDLVRAPEQLTSVVDRLPAYKVLSVGVVNGRNVWRTDLNGWLDRLQPVKQKLGERLWVGPSCSLLHSPVDVDQEQGFAEDVRQWLAFAVQKNKEIAVLAKALNGNESAEINAAFEKSSLAFKAKHSSSRIHDQTVQARIQAIDDTIATRQLPYHERIELQRQQLKLPLLPTTTIGSFPQTTAIRAARKAFKAGKTTEADYRTEMQRQIAEAISRQEALDLDVLVHGEAERNDMVEYFGEQLSGFLFSQHGWVQSYGSRCVKPPIILGDIKREQPMTVEWIRYAQSLTEKPLKGMLTGPVTMLCWSFPREDVSREVSCLQLALALRDEVQDLEKAGIHVIQIDEPAIREGLPLRKAEWQQYLDWAVRCFKIASCGVENTTQIHTHMCYSEFNDIIEAIAALDADVITIETSRSDMELLDAFEDFAYPNDIGPGVYDIHSPNVPSPAWIKQLLKKAANKIALKRLWVNPDCGLKTRDWAETEQALANMVTVAKELREEYQAV
ncbi:5-methyltetrahydropteroyltriglutamate--homocysteine S-methyltransferase [Endozoicomonas sp. SM1973]|uniref:5-methyltetrahydropteroyltriglutamate--homocysteine methyltransferase n=1 Tax=Spartinivicinus marinus TaxID=2994442 RepID=A0A853HZE8_9GAMM|nr:5-methyltetrahydropteroyltriglutamate--homocysteine S-methyltransferase [Spartinivicinus marinus]MCX4028643.1 5-methyltetrahydropteroyltriglutamate--homocysteine S-methyltransferase [Spartinivicinus marinus]NYZ67090.1 5-methyltetrahydropteroyltriglutamate--homocysteine S-methyltransferase [Spartinivicinus marinus]